MVEDDNKFEFGETTNFIERSISTATEMSDYTFSFSTNTAFEVGDKVFIKFPRSFD